MAKSLPVQGFTAGGFGHFDGRMRANRKKSMAAMTALIRAGALVRLARERSLVVLSPAAAPLWRN